MIGREQEEEKVNGWKRVEGCGCELEGKPSYPKEGTCRAGCSQKASPSTGWFPPGHSRPKCTERTEK